MSASQIADVVLSYDNLVHATAGATGGMSAISLFYPLNMARLKLQVDENMRDRSFPAVIAEIYADGGLSAVYQGWWAQVVALGTSNFVYFYTYNVLKTLVPVLQARLGLVPGKALSPGWNLVVASVAGVINVLATTPLWVVQTQLALARKKKAKAGSEKAGGEEKEDTSVWGTLQLIAKREGVAGLWSGTLPSLVLVSNPSIQFVTYENLRAPMARLAARRGRDITSLEFFFMGAIAKAVATFMTYPLQIAQSRLRADRRQQKKGATAGSGATRKYTGSIDVLSKIYASKGWRGWFKGINTKLWQTVLTAAFQFLTYETIAKIIFAVMRGGGGGGAGSTGNMAQLAKAKKR